MTEVEIRPIERRDYPLLEEFLYQAIFVHEGEELPAREIIYQPEIYVYIDGFGGKDDIGGLPKLTDRSWAPRGHA